MGKKQSGFTIVELAVVIVVISILATITILSYRGVQNQTYDSNVQTDLKNIAAAIKSYRVNTGAYPPASVDIASMDSVEGVNPRVTRSAYDVDQVLGDGHIRNLIICKQEGATPKFGIAALAKSGNSWFYKLDGGVTQNTLAWDGTSALCGQLGVASGQAGYANWFAYDRVQTTPADSGWRGWATK